MKKALIIALAFSIFTGAAGQKEVQSLQLSGKWQFKADPSDQGIREQWYAQNFRNSVSLPGSMATNGLGDDITLKTPWTGQIVDSSLYKSPEYEKYRQAGHIKIPSWLQPVKYYKGAAWYQKNITIPASWKGKHLELFIERSHWETTVWLDNRLIGMQNSLNTPHVFDLSKYLKPGKHKLTVRVDNRVKDINFGQNSHSISDHTQTNWNGMIGRLCINARPALFIDDVQLFPDLKARQVIAKIKIRNLSGKAVKADLKLTAIPENPQEKALITKAETVKVNSDSLSLEVACNMGNNPLLWDEFHPNLYKMRITLTSGENAKDEKNITFGMRDFKTLGTQFTINGRPVFLRGTLECCIFPKTGYPPTDVESWLRIFRICRAHGLNHVRFHSWCPPEAAFEAADRTGFYLHIECGSWANQGSAIGDGKPIDRYIYDESTRIVKAYGNHPSFCMLAYGNEPAGENQVKYLTDFVNYWKKKDSRRLYTTASGWPVIPESDYNSTPDPRIQHWGEGLQSIINSKAPGTDYDWTSIISKWKQPTVSHEIGQWCVYPDFKEIVQYDGVLKARNFEIFREKLEEHHLSSLADSFLLASGKLQALCYKADIEAALRTRGMGGFQLLDLHDFPGQGTALVGVLNAFWGEKGYISPQEYSRFCNSTVPLVRLHKMIFNEGDTLVAPVEIANFGESKLKGVVPSWALCDAKGDTVLKGMLPKCDIGWGNGITVGKINQPLPHINKARKLTLTVEIGRFSNSWDIWVYPFVLPQIDSSQVRVVRALDEATLQFLKAGGKVLLTPEKGSLKAGKGGNIPVGFSSIFWNTAWTGGQAPNTLGILCNPNHPALSEFPTDYYSNYQWWDAMSHSNAIALTDFGPELKPIVRVIDDWFTARPLALLFEAKIGQGKLIVSGIDLLSDAGKRPEARQLLYSLKKYMSGESFNPAYSTDAEKIKALFK